MPSLTTSPSLGNYMAISSRDGLVTAPCVPAPIQPSGFLRARLRSSFDHPDSVPCFPHAPATDEIASALGLQTQSVLEYPKPMPVSRYDELIDHLEALTLEDEPAPVSLGNSGYVPGAMATPRSMTAPRSMAAPRSMTTPRSVATPRSMDTAISAMFAQERAMTSSAGHPAQGRTDDVYNWGQGDEMSSVEFHNPTRQAHTSGNVDGVQHPNSGPNSDSNSDPGPEPDPPPDPQPQPEPELRHLRVCHSWTIHWQSSRVWVWRECSGFHPQCPQCPSRMFGSAKYPEQKAAPNAKQKFKRQQSLQGQQQPQ
ncbi:hypothetical protein JCM33374_g4327 [Metschnikowia sp. JCM 33374]|nr:hypothetical protein JCM33374_g4327 [Metschnikowia sp. JCM 33374]